MGSQQSDAEVCDEPAAHPPAGAYANGEEELYNLAKDPDEWHNLAGKPEHGETLRQLAEMLPDVNAPVDGKPKRKK